MDSLKTFLLTLGIPGLFAVVALDSAGVPMPGGPDAVVMLLCWQRPALVPLVALTAALGSVVGCCLLYVVGKKGGDMALRKFDPAWQRSVKDKLRRNDILALFVAVIGPPPFPTKVFVLTAGAIRMSWARFVATVFAGRFLRYLGEGYLGARFGDEAAGVLKAHYPTILLALLGAAVLFVALRHVLQSRSADAA